MDKKYYGLLIMIAGLAIIAGMFFDSYTQSVISEEDDTYEVGGGVKTCGYYYSGYTSEYLDFANFCETQGYTCFTDSWEGSLGTMYEVECQQYCYECVNGETQTWVYAPTCEDGGYETLDESDATSIMNGENVDLSSYCEQSVETTCYQCDGGSIESQTVQDDSCPSSWTTDWEGLDCEETTPTVTCYKCKLSGDTLAALERPYGEGTTLQSGEYYTEEYEESCPVGWSQEVPECPVFVDCYQCQDGSVVERPFLGECSEGWLETEPDNCTQMVQCYQCEKGVLNAQEHPNECKEGWSEQRPETCEAGATSLRQIYSFDQNATRATFAYIASAMTLGGLVYFIRSSGSSKSSGQVRL